MSTDLWALNWPTPRHTLSCPIWTSPDPADVCDCGAADEPPSVAELIDRICPQPIDENRTAS